MEYVQLDKISDIEYGELLFIIQEREKEVNAMDKKCLTSLFCNANNVATEIVKKERYWDYDKFERISNEVYLTNLLRFLRINKRI